MSDIFSEITHGIQAADDAFKAVAPLANVITPLVPPKAADALTTAVTSTTHVVEMTQAAINAMTASIPAEAVAAANAAPAPHSAFEQMLAAMDSRVKSLEALMHGVAPVIDVAAAAASVAYPPAAPILARVSTLESVLEGVLTGLDGAFGGKVAAPAPGSVTGG